MGTDLSFRDRLAGSEHAPAQRHGRRRIVPVQGVRHRAADILQVPGVGRMPVSMIDAANPCVFVPAEAIGATATEPPTEIEGNSQLMAKLEAIRRAASVAMGIAPDIEKAGNLSVPIVAF